MRYAVISSILLQHFVNLLYLYLHFGRPGSAIGQRDFVAISMYSLGFLFFLICPHAAEVPAYHIQPSNKTTNNLNPFGIPFTLNCHRRVWSMVYASRLMLHVFLLAFSVEK